MVDENEFHALKRNIRTIGRALVFLDKMGSEDTILADIVKKNLSLIEL